MMITRWLTYVSLGALLVLPVRAETRVDERSPAPPDGVVKVGNATGKLTIVGWDKAEVTVSGTLGAGTKGLTLKNQGRRTDVELELEHGSQGEAELEVRVPAGSEVEVEGFAASTSVSGVKGAVRIETVNGSITVAAAGGELELQAVNGAISVTGTSSRVQAEAVNGAVTLKGVGGDVEASAVNGKLSVEGGRFKHAELHTVSGGMQVQCDLEPGARMELNSVSGQIELSLPASVSASFNVASFSGRIENELGPEAPKTGRITPQKELTFTTGSGSASVEIHTLSGGITLRKR